MSNAVFGFDGDQHMVYPWGYIPVPLEIMLPAAYLLLAVLLTRRFLRTEAPDRAMVYASIGAWIGTLLPAALLLMVPGNSETVLGVEAALAGLSLIGMTWGLVAKKGNT